MVCGHLISLQEIGTELCTTNDGIGSLLRIRLAYPCQRIFRYRQKVGEPNVPMPTDRSVLVMRPAFISGV